MWRGFLIVGKRGVGERKFKKKYRGLRDKALRGKVTKFKMCYATSMLKKVKVRLSTMLNFLKKREKSIPPCKALV